MKVLLRVLLRGRCRRVKLKGTNLPSEHVALLSLRPPLLVGLYGETLPQHVRNASAHRLKANAAASIDIGGLLVPHGVTDRGGIKAPAAGVGSTPAWQHRQRVGAGGMGRGGLAACECLCYPSDLLKCLSHAIPLPRTRQNSEF